MEENTIPHNPDVLIVFNDKINTSIERKYFRHFTNSKSKQILDDKFKTKTDKFNKFTDIQEEVDINGNIYILDSILLRFGNKSIVGFRCDGEKYVYNNFSYTFDSPCSVIKFDWKYDNGEFCYNPIKCKLEDEKIDDIEKLCFDFNKGDKTLIYIKKDNIEKNQDIPDIPDNYILEIIKKIKLMPMAKLIQIIQNYDPKIVSAFLNKEELEKIVLKLYIIYYNKITNDDKPSDQQNDSESNEIKE